MTYLPPAIPPPIAEPTLETGRFWPRLLKGAALILIGAVAHQWALPAQRNATTGPLVGATSEQQTDDLAANRPEPPPSPLWMPREIAVPVATAGMSYGTVQTFASTAGMAVGTAGMMEVAATAGRAPTPSLSDSLQRPIYPATEIEADVRDAVAKPGAAIGHPTEPKTSAGNGAGDTQPASEAGKPLHPVQSSPLESTLGALVAARALPPARAPMMVTAPRLDSDDDLAGVREALRVYRTAYEQLDVAAAKTVWPSVDAAALNQAFRQLASQRLTFQACGISVSGESASARCRGSAEYVPKVGAHRALQASGEWVFDLAKRETSWEIVGATVR
jgi:hypothetical protein